MFAAFLRVEWSQTSDRYSDKASVKIVPLSACSNADSLKAFDIPDEIVSDLTCIECSNVSYQSTAFLCGTWLVKTSIVNNHLPN